MVLAPDLCQPWIGSAEVRCLTKFAALTDAQIAPFLMPASEICYKLSGRRFPGECTVTDLRPCLQSPGYVPLPRAVYPGFEDVYGTGIGAAFWMGLCGCGGQPWAGSCACTQGIFQLDLSPYVPTSKAQVSEVRVDGAALDPADYTVYDWQYLCRTDGNSWPLAQQLDLPSTEPNTWAVDFTYGTKPPEDAQLACAVMCGELALMFVPGSPDCELPERFQQITRQGITFVVADPLTYLIEGKTGIFLIDAWLSAVNPGNTRAPAVLSYPGKGGVPGRLRT